ncbi:MAG: mannitol dehydrogenase [Christensenellaceae bacterium]
MKKAVMYGAGNIGRGFIGKVLSESGYEVCFLDIAQDIIAAFNKDRQYTVKVVSNEEQRNDIVKNVRAVDANTPQAIKEIADCDLMATSVGVNVMPYIVGNIAEGIKMRMKQGNRPLDIILAENQLDADKIMRNFIYEKLNDEQKAWADKNLGLVEASIGRMVPPLTADERTQNPLLIAVEEYALLPVDSAAFKGEIPQLVGIVPYTPFGFYIKRKLFIHNMGHALCAYFGKRAGCEYIWQAVEIPEVYESAKKSMECVAQALNMEYGVPLEEILDNVTDLLYRFKNKALKDTVARVGGDPIRKIRKDDRLVGAALYCLEFGLEPTYIVKGIAAALKFYNPDDQSSVKLKEELCTKGLEAVMEQYMGLKADSVLAGMIKKAFEE